MSDSDGRMSAEETNFEYGSGGRKISMLPADPGVCEGIGAEAAAGTFKTSTRGPSDLNMTDSDDDGM